jgi:drug/metabolite transporter (DMT)-like permease
MSSPSPSAPASTYSKAGLIHLFIVYVVWGSTYLAIRVGMRPGSGFTPFFFGAMRVLIAGAILLAWAALSHRRIRLTRPEFLVLAGSGLLLWVTGNGLVMVGEIHADSGITSLIIAGVPIWIMVYEAILERRRPSALMITSLLVGLAGIVLLSMPLLLSGIRTDALSVICFLVASFSWAGGTLLQSHQKLNLDPSVLSGYQMIFGGIGFTVAALVLREPLPHPVLQAWLAWGYLVIFGSLIAFTSYLQALRMLPTRIVATYSYVNPLIAVFLGWAILGEKVTPWTIGGAVLILIGVTGVFRSRKYAHH